MRNLFSAIFLLIACQSYAFDWQDGPELSKLFSTSGVKGTFVLYDVSANRFIGHERFRAETRFIPASTFKIPNSLIGLSTGVVKSVDEVMPYGGKPQPVKAWEHDMGLREAIKISNVPIYKELARRIGLDAMRENFAKIGYGNGEIGTAVDDFWLIGPLKISAVEQAQFLARLAKDELPFPKDIQAKVREIVQLEQGNGWILYGKTGWDSKIGWWVGWVQKENRIYSFALNIDMPDTTNAAKRIELGKACLKTLGVL
ncbi:MAG: class D beta-lactamase [Victivallales bacterium]|jgi:beta-lactamase class D